MIGSFGFTGIVASQETGRTVLEIAVKISVPPRAGNATLKLSARARNWSGIFGFASHRACIAALSEKEHSVLLFKTGKLAARGRHV